MSKAALLLHKDIVRLQLEFGAFFALWAVRWAYGAFKGTTSAASSTGTK